MENELIADVAGRVAQVQVEAGGHVHQDQVIIVIEAMKMEFELCAPRSGLISRILVQVGDVVEEEQLLATLSELPIQGVL